MKVEYNDVHKYALKLRGFPFTLQTNTVSHLWDSKYDSHKWPTMLVDDHCILLLHHLSTHMHFITNGYKRFL